MTSDEKRKKFIVSTILLSLVLLTTFGLLIQCAYNVFYIASHEEISNNSIGLFVNILLSLFFILLYWFSKKGRYKEIEIIILTALYFLATYMGYKWGMDLPASILFFALIVSLSGILINSVFAFISTLIIILTIAIINYLQRNDIIHTNDYWRAETWTFSNVIMVAVIFIVIAVVVWLTNKETEKSLLKVKESEKKLKIKKKLLEIKVKERTRELEKAQAEKLISISKFAEYGKLAGGLFHDIVNPLTAVSLNIEKIKNTSESNNELRIIKQEIERINFSISRIERLISLTRKHFSNKEIKEYFSVNKEIKDVIEILSYKAIKQCVELIYEEKEINLCGNPIRFSQVLSNIIANAIDSYDSTYNNKPIIIITEEINNNIEINISDQGKGIPIGIQSSIFSIFTTKPANKGSGVGLYISKEIIENEFNGKIAFKTKENTGTTFIITIPKK